MFCRLSNQLCLSASPMPSESSLADLLPEEAVRDAAHGGMDDVYLVLRGLATLKLRFDAHDRGFAKFFLDLRDCCVEVSFACFGHFFGP